MGPVAFEVVVRDLDRPAMLAAARRLTEAGIRVTATSDGSALMVRSEDAARAAAALRATPPGQSSDPSETSDES